MTRKPTSRLLVRSTLIATALLLFWLRAFGEAAEEKQNSSSDHSDEDLTRGFRESFDKDLEDRWKVARFSEKTDYRIVLDGDTNSVLQALADRSASGLGVEKKIRINRRTKIQWRWKVQRTPVGGSETNKESFDHSARLFVAFKTILGPPRTINYVWANHLKPGESFDHPRTSRARFIVIETGNAKAGEWVSVSRDLAADWTRLFGKSLPPYIVGIGLMTDTDDTRDRVMAWYDDIRIFEE